MANVIARRAKALGANCRYDGWRAALSMVGESNLRHPLLGKTQNHYRSVNAIPGMRQSGNGVFMLRQAVEIAGWISCCVFRVIAPSASDCSMDAKQGLQFRARTYQMSRDDVVRAGIECIGSHCAASVSAHVVACTGINARCVGHADAGRVQADAAALFLKAARAVREKRWPAGGAVPRRCHAWASSADRRRAAQ